MRIVTETGKGKILARMVFDEKNVLMMEDRINKTLNAYFKVLKESLIQMGKDRKYWRDD